MRAPLALVLALVAAGCSLPGPAPGTTTTVDTTTPPVTTPNGGGPIVPEFDGDRAFAHVEEQVAWPNGTVRYRVPGTEGNAAVAQLIDDTLTGLGWNVTRHEPVVDYRCDRVQLNNVVAERAGTSGRVVLLGAHFDTRPVADKDPDRQRRDEPIVGANDGASGVAVLLELARVLPPLPDTVRLVFFDGEDGGGLECGTDWILGSRAYAASLSADEARAIRAMVLVDMVGDPDLRLPREGISASGQNRALQDRIYAVAGGLGYASVFLNETGPLITDDHVPFHERGIPSVDLIHITGTSRVFPAWHHTQADDVGAVSAGSLAVVGRTLEVWLRAR